MAPLQRISPCLRAVRHPLHRDERRAAMMASLLQDHTSAAAQRTMLALMGMKKLDIDALRRAHAGA